MAQFTKSQLEQLTKMGFARPAWDDPCSDYVTAGDSGDHVYDQRVWTSSGLAHLFDLSSSVYAEEKFVADDRLSSDGVTNGLGVGFDCPIAAATWLLLQEANRV